MAGWVAGGGIGKKLHSHKSVLEVAVLIFIATYGASIPTLHGQTDESVAVTTSYMRSPSLTVCLGGDRGTEQPKSVRLKYNFECADLGFVSLDCGGAQANYTDQSNGLHWVSDEDSISTGNSSEQSYKGGQRALRSFRYFPEYRSKHCYELSTPNFTYLLRASFYMDQTTMTARTPFQFVFSIDATNWFTVTSGDVASLLVVQEGIFNLPDYYTNFCLQPVHGVPFISSLELRPMSSVLYNYLGFDSQYLPLGVRYNTGAQNAPDLRYPVDPYDRIWTTPASLPRNVTIIKSTHPTDNTTRYAIESYVPAKVMEDAWLFPADGSGSVSFPVYADGPQVYVTPSAYAQVFVYYENLDASASGPHKIDIFLDDDEYDDRNFSTDPHLFWKAYFSLSDNAIKISLASSSASPSMNAIEIYGQLNYNFSITNFDDTNVISALKTGFSLTDWQGDPCVPVPFDWLSCDLSEATYGPPQLPSPQEDRTIFQATFNVTSLNISDIAHTNFSSIIGNSSALPSARLRGLITMSITNSAVDKRTFLFLINYISRGLKTLNLSHNAIGYLPRGIDWAGTDTDGLGNLTTLDVSHNDLTGALSSFDHVPFSTTLQYLNLSNNRMTSFPLRWGNTTINSLVTLDLSYNQLRGSMSSLDDWVQINSGSLRELDISHNQLAGGFSSNLYFSLPQLTYANFDQNSIEGVLNLSAWYAALQDAASTASKDSSQTAVTQRLYSFMNNSISEIVPNAKDIDFKVYNLSLQHRSVGILLHGNPYCNSIKSSVQLHLCRSSINDPFKEESKKDTTKILIIGICGGIVALLCFSVTSATLWKLWKQLYTLREIQQALADRKVQPPFYHYNDLKTATKDFHQNNKLGNGGFGVVYKGVLADETLAVKKLFNSHKVQVIDEFLNEVVLITGIKHRNLVQLKGCCIKDKQRILVYEYADKGNLAEALWGSQVQGELSWKQRINICVGVARGLSYLHEELQPSIIHRDIKPPNILLDKDLNPKIADFGLARHFSEEINQAHYTQIAGTIGYFAPEYAMQGQVSDKTDVYSYGILILEVVSGRKCIDPTRPGEEKFLKDWVFSMRKKSLLFDVLQPELRGNSDVAEVIRAINIALLCVQHHPERRPTMSQVVTMLLGNMDVEVFPDEFNTYILPNLENLIAPVNLDVEHPTLHIIEEESPLWTSSSSFNISSTKNSRPLIELSDIRGR